MPSSLATIRQALAEAASPELRKAKSWREDLSARLGKNNRKLHEILISLAEGIPYQVELADGLMSSPIVPTPDVRLRAAMYLDEKLNGKAVAQTEIRKAEEEERERASIKALSEDELYAEAKKILERSGRVINAGPETDAVLVQSENVEVSAEGAESFDQETLDEIWGTKLKNSNLTE